MNPEQVTRQIRFALSDLPTQNAHHTFEHICRHLTEQFICSNVLPATGPVSAGGDQGRDFETFRSYLREELGPSGGFLGLVSDVPIAFICTTQADNIPTKLRSDIEKVCGFGSPVSAIRAFTLHSLPAGPRHRLQDQVRERWNVELEVHDAESIANLLSKPEGFWIAEQFLSMPAEVRPAQTPTEGGLDEEYVQRRARWHNDLKPRPTIGDFISLRSGAREATFQEAARPDLPFWLGRLRDLLLHPSLPASIRQRARYELVVASLRGVGDMRPVDDVAREFLNDSLNETEPARLQDAAVLLQYGTGAAGHAVTTVGLNELHRWNSRITKRVQGLLADSTGHRRAGLLDVLGLLGMQRAVSEEQLAEARASWDDAPRANAILPESSLPPGINLTEDDFIDLRSSVAAWTELAEALEDTPLFPVDRLSRLLGMFVPALIDMPEWRNLVDLLDQAVERTSGKSAVAARARDRAFALLKADRRIDALEEFHKVKLDWWSGDSVRGSLLAMLMQSKLYLELRLPLAAKSHALGAAFIAATHDDGEHADLVAQGLRMAASADMMSGAWCGATELHGRAIATQYAVSELRTEPETVDWFKEPDLHLTYITQCAGAIDEGLLKSVQAITTSVDVQDVVEMVLSSATPTDDERPWASFGAEDLTGPPFSDLGATRYIRFSALGTDWAVMAANDAETNRIAERFAAGAQVMLAALAREDLCLVPTQITVNLEKKRSRSSATKAVESLPSNDGRSWIVRLTPFDDATGVSPEEFTSELVGVLTVILREASLLQDDDFTTAIERAFQHGLAHKLFPPRPYDELAAAFAADEETQIRRGVWDTPWSAREGYYEAHMELAWQDGPGPTYSEEKARDLLDTRYQNLARVLRKTIPKLKESSGFLRTVGRLRSEEGWLDWHILTAVLNLTMSYRFPLQPSEYPSETVVRQMNDAAYEPEPDDARVVPAYRLTPRTLREARQRAMLSLVHIWGLTLHQRTPDFPAIERLLAARYGYWTDDAPHDDLLPEDRVSK